MFALNFPLLPERASSMAGQVDLLFWFLVLVTVFFMSIVFLPMFYFLYKYRRGNDVDRTPLNITTWKIEVVWSVIPLGIGIVIFLWGAGLYMREEQSPRDALEINVVGKQWMWNVQHLEGKRELNELHVPIGRTINLTMTSQDVIHSFFIPVFRIKHDVVPGRYTTEWFKATKTGTFHLFCTELCGAEHSGMVGKVVVLTQPEYQQWINQGTGQDSLAAAGEKLYLGLGCSGCHGENSKIRAPSLAGLYGHPVPLDTGEIVIADDRYIHDSILLPLKQVVASYEPVMPSYQGQISEEQVFQLIQYIKSLSRYSPDEYLRQNQQVAGRSQRPLPGTEQFAPSANPVPGAGDSPAPRPSP
jgi:cytochrome c oxidase subunit 2